MTTAIDYVETLLHQFKPPLAESQKLELQRAMGAAFSENLELAEEKSIYARGLALMKKKRANMTLKDVRKKGSTASIRNIADFLQKHIGDWQEWQKLKDFTNLRDDVDVGKLFLQHPERREAYGTTSLQVATALRLTKQGIQKLRDLLCDLSRRNTHGLEVARLVREKRPAKDQRMQHKVEQHEAACLEVQEAKKILESHLNDVLEKWNAVRLKMDEEVKAWEDIGRTARKLHRFYCRCTAALKVGVVSLAVLGAGVIAAALAGATLISGGVPALIMAISAEMLGICAVSIMGAISSRAQERVESITQLGDEAKKDRDAAGRLCTGFQGLKEYGEILGVEMETGKDFADIASSVRNIHEFSYKSLNELGDEGLAGVEIQLEDSIEELTTLDTASKLLQTALGKGVNVVETLANAEVFEREQE